MAPRRMSGGSHLVSRRDVLQLGALGACGLSLPALLRARAGQSTTAGGPAPRRAGRAKACLILFQQGGPSHHDTFDMKPDAPAEIRGEFRPIATRVPGTHVCEHMPLTARQAHRFGVRGGTTYGASDQNGANPTADPVTPQDVAATIYHCLGIDPETRLPDRLGRPVEVGSGGKPILSILA